MAKAKKKHDERPEGAVTSRAVFFEPLDVKLIPLIEIPDPASYEGDVRAQQQAAFSCIQKGDRAGAVQAYEALSQAYPKDVKTANMLAALYVHLERYEEAVPLLRKIMRQAPSDFIAPNNMAVCLMRQLKYDAAEKYLKSALKNGIHVAEIHHNFGVFYQKTEHLEAALRAYEGALALKPLTESLLGEALVYMMRGESDLAESAVQRVFERDPTSDMAHFIQGGIYVQRQAHEEALSHLIRALNKKPDEFYYVMAFIETVHRMDMKALQGYKDLGLALLNAFRYERAEHRKLTRLWMMWIDSDDCFAGVRALLDDPAQVISAEQFAALSPELEDEFFWLGLQKTTYFSWRFEEMFRALRRYILVNRATLKDKAQVPLNFLYALAEYCFFNEYVFVVSEEEKASLDDLRAQKSHDAIDFLLLGCYQNFYGSALEEALLEGAVRIDDPRFHNVVAYQLRHPQEEEEIKAHLKTFGTIANAVSQKVKGQYEENPYPRWRYFTDVSPEKRYVLQKESDGPACETLIAGCGTGR